MVKHKTLMKAKPIRRYLRHGAQKRKFGLQSIFLTPAPPYWQPLSQVHSGGSGVHFLVIFEQFLERYASVDMPKPAKISQKM